MSTRRCPSCGGLVGADAEWCGQCLHPLDAPLNPTPAPRPAEGSASRTEPAASAAPPPGPATEGDGRRTEGPARPIRAGEKGIVWECPTCSTENPIEAATCRGCGTAFGRLLEEEPARPDVDPGRAMALSLLFPGIGHAAAGRKAEGIARAVVFAYNLATVVTILVMRAGGGLGPFLPLLLISAAAGVALYGVTAVDAGRVARGDRPVLSTRALLYGALGLMLLMLAVLVILSAGRAGSPGLRVSDVPAM